MTILVDPPEGWKYGFPAPRQEDYRKQLIDAGYPKNQIEFAIKHSRYIFDAEDKEEVKRMNE